MGTAWFDLSDSQGNKTAVSGSFDVGPQSAGDDLVSVAVFPTYSSKVYGNHAAVLTKLKALGIKGMRHLLLPDMSAKVQKFTADANAAGIKSWVTVGKPRQPYTDADWATCEALLKGPLRGMVTRVFGWNEPNHQRSSSDPPTTGWAAMTITECGRLWAMIQRVNADYLTDGTPGILVGTPGLWSGDPQQQFSDLLKLAPGIQGWYDFIGWHWYMRPVGGTFDPTSLVTQETRFRASYGYDANILCTEGGYFTAPNYTGGSNPVTEEQQAALIPQLVDWYVSRGYGLCYMELLDDPDPTGTLREASFGVVRTPSLDPTTWTLKPAFATFRDAIAAA